MNPELYLVRPFADADFELMSRLFSLENPEDPTTEEDQRHFEQTFSAPHFFRKKWTVEGRRTGKSVAVGILAHSPFRSHPRKFWAMVIVDPDHRGRGVGRALSALIDAEAVSLQAECLWLTIRRDDLRSMDFTQKQGFLELRRLWLSSLEVPRANLPMDSDRGTALEREGIRFATLAEEGPESSEGTPSPLRLVRGGREGIPRSESTARSPSRSSGCVLRGSPSRPPRTSRRGDGVLLGRFGSFGEGRESPSLSSAVPRSESMGRLARGTSRGLTQNRRSSESLVFG